WRCGIAWKLPASIRLPATATLPQTIGIGRPCALVCTSSCVYFVIVVAFFLPPPKRPDMPTPFKQQRDFGEDPGKRGERSLSSERNPGRQDKRSTQSGFGPRPPGNETRAISAGGSGSVRRLWGHEREFCSRCCSGWVPGRRRVKAGQGQR